MTEEVFVLQGRKEDGDKRKVCYSVQIVVIFMSAVALLIMAALAYCFILAGELNRSIDDAARFQLRAEELAGQNEELFAQNGKIVKENKELQEKVEILSHTINEKVQQEQERAAETARTYVPTGFPLRGTASCNETRTELEGNPIAVFNASEGTGVVATANGTVLSVTGDAEAGYTVMIDHGNGYRSVYRNGAVPKVKEGDEVTNATELFNIEAGKEELGYQIIENEEYIEPLSFMETYG